MRLQIRADIRHSADDLSQRHTNHSIDAIRIRRFRSARSDHAISAHWWGIPSLRRLVHRFYALMDTLPEAWDVRKLHPDDLSGSEEKLSCLSGWLGGPDLLSSAFGHPRLRARHLPFEITQTVNAINGCSACVRQCLNVLRTKCSPLTC